MCDSDERTDAKLAVGNFAVELLVNLQNELPRIIDETWRSLVPIDVANLYNYCIAHDIFDRNSLEYRQFKKFVSSAVFPGTARIAFKAPPFTGKRAQDDLEFYTFLQRFHTI